MIIQQKRLWWERSSCWSVSYIGNHAKTCIMGVYVSEYVVCIQFYTQSNTSGVNRYDMLYICNFVVLFSYFTFPFLLPKAQCSISATLAASILLLQKHNSHKQRDMFVEIHGLQPLQRLAGWTRGVLHTPDPGAWKSTIGLKYHNLLLLPCGNVFPILLTASQPPWSFK